MTLEKYGKLLARYIKKNFSSNIEAGEFYGCKPSMVSNVKAGRKKPNPLMLQSTGHKLTTEIVKA